MHMKLITNFGGWYTNTERGLNGTTTGDDDVSRVLVDGAVAMHCGGKHERHMHVPTQCENMSLR
jgi:hypothetical protein